MCERDEPVHVIGGGLAGSECAYQLARQGISVVLWEMRPRRSSPAHRSDALAELVCSNSLRSDDPHHPAGLLKREMEALDSLVVATARRCAVPAGSALAVDREAFSRAITESLESHTAIEIRRQEVQELPPGPVVVATGPLTSEAMSSVLTGLLGREHLYFYDAISPVVEAESLDEDRLFAASRYGRGEGDDYLNSPLDRDLYLRFHAAVLAAEVLPLPNFESTVFFEGCLPIEELARRGVDTLRYGPMKPVGLMTPEGRRPYAVVQLRQEDLSKSQYSLVGFQSRMSWPAQRRVLRMLPGLNRARFVRLGQVHRNTFVNSPLHLDVLYRLKSLPRLRLAGQITGVEGYLESAATGLVIGRYVARERAGEAPRPLPPTTALGALARHVTESDPERFQPANINFGLFPPLARKLKRRERRRAYAERAHEALAAWLRHAEDEGPGVLRAGSGGGA